MPTPAERKALFFLAGVILLGASVRVVRAARDDGAADASTRQALSRQLAAVDSAKRDERGPRASRRGKGGGGARRRQEQAAVAPRADSSTTSTPLIDLDVAPESEIEKLPRIGPVLARRIVEDRAEHGPFGSMPGFERVRGVGPSLAALLASRVTFSGTARPSNALVEQRLSTSRAPPKSPRRERRK